MIDLAAADPAAIQVDNLSGLVRDRKNNAVFEKLRAVSVQNTQCLEILDLPVIPGHGFPNGSSAKTDLKTGKHRRIHETALVQILLAGFMLAEGGVVKIRDQRQQLRATKDKFYTGSS